MSHVAESPWVGVVVSRYNGAITSAMLEGAQAALHERFPGGQLTVVDVPGAFELPVVAAELVEREEIDTVVCLGCIIRGQTRHDRVLAGAIAGQIAQLAVRQRKPVAFGVLTCESIGQARARAGGEQGNKGTEAMHAALDVWTQLVRLRESRAIVGEHFALGHMPPDKTLPGADRPGAAS